MATAQTLVIVPTSGNTRDKDGEVVPGRAAQRRLRTARDYITTHGEARLAISGGARDCYYTEANVALRWLFDQRIGISEFVVICEGSDVCTAGDMFCLAMSIHRYEMKHNVFFNRLVIVSHSWHAELAKMTLAYCFQDREFEILDSGESQPFGRLSYILRRFVTKYDPIWGGPLSWPLRILSNRRRDSCP